MAAPNEIKKRTLQQLRQTLLKMNSPAWVLALRKKDDAVRREAAMAMLRTQEMRLDLENAILADIRDRLVANEKALQQGRARLSNALDDLKKVRQVLNAVTSFLEIAARVVAVV